MTDIPAMLLWTDSYLGDTSHLTTTQHGAYLLILMAMWRAGGNLPDDEVRLAPVSKLSLDKWRKIAGPIMEFMTVEGGSVTQKRLKLELEIASCKMEKAVLAGRAGGRASALKRLKARATDASSPVEPNANQTPSETQPNQLPITSHHSQESSLRSDECASADALPAAEPKKRKVRNRLEETQLSESSQPNKAQCELAVAAGLDVPAFRFHWQAFRSWHVTRGEWRKDWVQSWAKWVGGIAASQKIMAPVATMAQPRAAPPHPDSPQEIRNPALRALQRRLSQKNAQRTDEQDIFASRSGPCQPSSSAGNPGDETGAEAGRFGPVLNLAAYR